MIRRTSNPALGERLFEGVSTTTSDGVMSMEGTVNKSLIAIGITAAMGAWAFQDPTFNTPGFMIGSLILTFVLYLVMFFKKSLAPYITPLYAAAEGILLGVISASYAMVYDGIIAQAVSLTFATFFIMLMAYKTGFIKATPMLQRVIVSAAGGIALIYLIHLGMMLFGLSGFSMINGNGVMAIGFSVLCVGVASFMLILDFNMIEEMANSGRAPKYMEWYGAFALLVTLVWLYLEILRLLSKIQSRD